MYWNVFQQHIRVSAINTENMEYKEMVAKHNGNTHEKLLLFEHTMS